MEDPVPQLVGWADAPSRDTLCSFQPLPAPARTGSQRSPAEQQVLANHQLCLSTVFKHSGFRGVQVDVLLEWSVRGNDAVVVWKTGGGKTALFAVPALLHHSLTVVVLPLIALIEDVYRQLMDKHRIGTVFMHHQLDAERIRSAAFTIMNYPTAAKVILITPERAVRPDFHAFLRLLNRPVRVVVDEAHCVTEWGDFRQAYSSLGALKKAFPDSPVLAMTGTATAEGARSIADALHLTRPSIIMGETARSEMAYDIRSNRNGRSLRDAFPTLFDLLERHKGESGVIFVATVKSVTTTVQAILDKFGTQISVDAYHGQLSYTDKKAHAQRWGSGATKVMVATSAFGMGINNLACRFVIHLQMPSSLTAFQQESGRAGRDGRPATSYLLASRSDHYLWAPVFSKSARESIVKECGGQPPPISSFRAGLFGITSPRHQHLEEVWLFASLNCCRRWMLSVGISAVCMALSTSSLCDSVEKCDICRESSSRAAARSDLTTHARLIYEIVSDLNVAQVGATFDTISQVFIRGSKATDAIKNLPTYDAEFHTRSLLLGPKPTAKLASVLTSILIARGSLLVCASPPDMFKDDDDDEEDEDVTKAIRRHSFNISVHPDVPSLPVFVSL